MRSNSLAATVILSCTATALAQPDDPLRHPGPAEGGAHVVTTGQLLHPAGESVEFGGRPIDLALSPDARTLYVKDNRGLVVIANNPGEWKLRQELRFQKGGGSMHGIAISPDGARVLATNDENLLAEAGAGSDGVLAWSRTLTLPGPGGKGASYPCGVAFLGSTEHAAVCLSRNNALAIVDLAAANIIAEVAVGAAPYDVVVAPAGDFAYVSNLGGRAPGPGDRSAPSSGTPVLVDERGIASSGTVSVIDLGANKEVAQIDVGLTPADLLLSPDGRILYCANANSDTVSIIDTASRTVTETLTIRPDDALPFGSAPNALALDPSGRSLYIACAGNNAVAVVTLPAAPGEKPRIEGFVPTGWYPGALQAAAGHLFVANTKGLGSRLRPAKATGTGWRAHWYLGTATRVAAPDPPTLARYTQEVREAGRVPQILRATERAASEADGPPAPVPAHPGQPSVLRHIVYIIKENRTYDQVFGDIGKGNSDPSLCIFGSDVTPNHHALAEQFVLLDNFYCNGVLSVDGHSWATEGNVTGYIEKAFGGFTRSYTFGDDPLAYSSSGFIWDHVLARGHSFRNYGEMDYAKASPEGDWSAIYQDFLDKTGRFTFPKNVGIEKLRPYTAPGYPGWNLRIPDVVRADAFLKELAGFERTGDLPAFLLVYLPSDHTAGTGAGHPKPASMVADNDLSLGRIAEGLSHSRFWPDMCILAIEDDPQDGFDHVDGHRSICIVASPYARRGAVVSEFYNQTSVVHTIERIFGAAPASQLYAQAPVMTTCFIGAGEKPDNRPFDCLPNKTPLNDLNPRAELLDGEARHWAVVSASLPLERFDEADEDTLNRILWHSVKGVDTPYPAHLAGAHATGLAALKLRLEPGPGRDPDEADDR